MPTDRISARNAICLIMLSTFYIMIVSGAATAGQDTWIAILLAGVMFLPVILIYARICRLFPGKNVYEIITLLGGTVIGNILILLLAGYAMVIAVLVLRSIVEFTVVISLQDTPRIPLMIIIGAVALYLAAKGNQLLGRWSLIICIIIVSNVLFTLLVAYDTIDFSNMMPVMGHSFKTIADNAFMLGSISIGETILAMTFLGNLQPKPNPYKVYLIGITLGIAVIALVMVRNILIVGPEICQMAKFPSYMALRVIHMGSFFERLESIVSFDLILLGVTKMSLCLSAAAKGIAQLLKSQDYRSTLIPVYLLTVALCSLMFKNMLDIFDFVWGWRWLALAFQVLIPLFIWVRAELKARQTYIASG